MTLSARSLLVDGVPRRVLLVEPEERPTAIVLSLHGSRSGPEEQVRLSGMDRLAGMDGAVVAFPQGSARLGRGWAWDHEGDLPFLSLLIDRLREDFPWAGRVCVAGMSGGARMASLVGSARSDAVAAIGAVAGLRAPTRPPGRPVSVIAFHGTADRINRYAGGGRSEWRESVPDAARAWASANGVVASTRETPIGRTLTRTTYGDADGPGEVTLWTIRGGGHSWPGGRSMGLIARLLLGSTTREIDATREIWEYHRRHA